MPFHLLVGSHMCNIRSICAHHRMYKLRRASGNMHEVGVRRFLSLDSAAASVNASSAAPAPTANMKGTKGHVTWTNNTYGITVDGKRVHVTTNEPRTAAIDKFRLIPLFGNMSTDCQITQLVPPKLPIAPSFNIDIGQLLEREGMLRLFCLFFC